MHSQYLKILIDREFIRKRDPRAPKITSKIGGMTFTRFLLNTGANINILPKVVFDHHHVRELQPFLIELC